MNHSEKAQLRPAAIAGGKFGSVKLTLGVILTVIAAFCALFLGRYGLTPLDTLRILLSQVTGTADAWPAMTYNVIFRVRLPRVLADILVGGGLTLSGATYQGIFKNPLVSPDLLGISAGACVGAATAILMGLGSTGIQIYALAGGLLAVFLSMAIPRLLKNDSTLMLVLSGVIVSGLMNAIIGILKYVADVDTQLPEIIYWQMGSLANVSPEKVLSVFPAMLASVVVLFLMRWRVNIMSLGDTEAAALGVNIKVTRGVLILASTLLTGCAVCISGIVGWVGLIIPHLTRLIIGQDNVRLMPLSFFVGAIFMLFIDTMARIIIAAEIPLSILTGVIGAPLFFWLLMKTRTRL
ncbi:iron complex transport system permease protein [Sporobacter termitidis DSM 10068]|uniref:Iron complex transport system permease protein n=1 Tax=Sporobacter termitidis DSM 10068 TaxID=1123282 RepID=A0A1M5WDC6_9FIRM|nr:iron ABC transporter permease [Sporobacter termitidis]SHH85501.1 iron complex transport system permease protein [Sporobacter termitidis DSM 10068]